MSVKRFHTSIKTSLKISINIYELPLFGISIFSMLLPRGLLILIPRFVHKPSRNTQLNSYDARRILSFKVWFKRRASHPGSIFGSRGVQNVPHLRQPDSSFFSINETQRNKNIPHRLCWRPTAACSRQTRRVSWGRERESQHSEVTDISSGCDTASLALWLPDVQAVRRVSSSLLEWKPMEDGLKTYAVLYTYRTNIV